MRHFVFLGPPGTGKTTVARVIGKIFYAFGLLDMPEVVEAQRSDLVGEYLGATAIKTNELIDSALGRVLFIDEAYSLVNEGDGQSDRFGIEAVQTLLKRAEDDRENLIIILAGYEKQTESFLASNPGLASRFATRIRFPTYSPAELLALADSQLRGKNEVLAADARPVLWRILEEVGRRRITDELGNGRFVRTLLEKAGQARDVRVMGTGYDPAAEDLITIDRARPGAGVRRADLAAARLRGHPDAGERDRRAGRAGRAWSRSSSRCRRSPRSCGWPSCATGRGCPASRRPGTSCSPGRPAPARRRSPASSAGSSRRSGCWCVLRSIEAHRGDLVGEHLGSTAIKTNKLVDSALGGVLFIDEAYSLHNERLHRRRRVRRGGGADAAQAGRGRPGPAGDRARRVPRATWTGSCAATPAWRPGSAPA